MERLFLTSASSGDPSAQPDLAAAHDDALRRLQARLDRERAARREAESLLEEKSRALFKANQDLSQTAAELESRVVERTTELHKALQDARSANEAKSRFLALMSHEIRTPLNGVLGLSELLQTTELDTTQSAYVSNILNASNALLVVINDILDFSKIEAGEMSLELLEFDPVKLVQETLDFLGPMQQRKGVALEFCATPPLPVRMVSDPTRVRQVLFNLVGNAIKFTSTGKVTVSLHATPQALTCTVEDSGIGMSAATVAGLFEPFRQADNTIARKFGGTGLGLVICKALVEKMQGQMRVSSVEGSGSCFSFTLPLSEGAWCTDDPLHPAIQARPGGAQYSAAQADRSLLRILLVDDHPINRLMARSQLKQLGCLDVDEAHNGVQALECLTAKPYDVVLMDVQMPEMDGLDATRALRRMPIHPQPVVIAMTANAYSEDRDASLGAGMNHFLTKPVKLETLGDALHRVVTGELRPGSQSF